MSFIILVATKPDEVIVITDKSKVVIFPTEEKAMERVNNESLCKQFLYQIFEISSIWR